MTSSEAVGDLDRQTLNEYHQQINKSQFCMFQQQSDTSFTATSSSRIANIQKRNVTKYDNNNSHDNNISRKWKVEETESITFINAPPETETRSNRNKNSNTPKKQKPILFLFLSLTSLYFILSLLTSSSIITGIHANSQRCQVDNDCQYQNQGQRCMNDTCLYTCRSDDNCPLSGVCKTNICDWNGSLVPILPPKINETTETNSTNTTIRPNGEFMFCCVRRTSSKSYEGKSGHDYNDDNTYHNRNIVAPDVTTNIHDDHDSPYQFLEQHQQSSPHQKQPPHVSEASFEETHLHATGGNSYLDHGVVASPPSSPPHQSVLTEQTLYGSHGASTSSVDLNTTSQYPYLAQHHFMSSD
ncbi:11346_t:CDS:2 [Ambispora gerdemannii]|uniref:11346_t:CDS:1 n=1 Tax=Ambispora gerdemannii TaxID=144530 RepID=A0A9N9AK48_9GLOM|nr:11346_t:CDS:2 [Ambispora gerdemannii]